jgi:hypothetical protein
MQFFTPLHNTTSIILCALLARFALHKTSGHPGTTGDDCPCTPAFLARFAQKNSPPTTREQAALQHRMLAYFLPATWPVAAPFILFRLKRTGYSNCRVVVQEGGLLVTARR